MDALAPLQFLPLRLTRNPIAYVIDAVSDSITERQDLVYKLSLNTPRAIGSGEFTELISLPGRELPKRQEFGADVYPGAQFDVAVFVDDFLSRTRPALDQVAIVTCAELVAPFFVRSRVENGGVMVVGTEKTLPMEYALKGALAVEQFAGWRDHFFTTFQAEVRQFLTWQPVEKLVDPQQPEWLYWLVNATPKPAELRVRVDITYLDGTSETVTKLTTPASQYAVYSLPVGFSALGLAAHEAARGQLVHSYRVWVANETNGRLSQMRTYYLDRDYQANVLYLVFANSLGGYDTLRCTGQSSRALTVKGTNAQRALDPNYLPTTAELFSLDRTGERTLTVNTGLLDGDAVDYLAEVTVTEEIYVVTQEGLVALVPTDAPMTLQTDNEDLTSRTLTFRYGKNEVGFSVLPAAPTTPARATRWVPVNTFCLIDERGRRTGYLTAAKLELHYVDDGSLVKPLRSKSNTPGTDGYTPPTLSAICQATPYVNEYIEQPGRYRRNDCPADQEGGVATLVIEEDTYGAETEELLQARVSQALADMDTQAYANQYGSCLLNPAGYLTAVAAGCFHYRGNLPGRLGVAYNGSPAMGNSWNVQGQGGAYVFAQGSNDLDFPVSDATPWLVFVYGKPFGQGRLRVWLNGVLRKDVLFGFNSDGFELHGLLLDTSGVSIDVANGNRLYVQLTDL